MKKFIYSVIGLAAMLFAASCEQEPKGVAEGDVVDATFSVNLGGLQTKAYSDGTSATKLQVFVYNSKGYLSAVSKLNETINITAQVPLKLVKGETYDIIFWAQNPSCSAYTISTADKTLTVNPSGIANDETRDAFYAFYTTGMVTGPIQETITLKRPFAQINVLDNIDDWKAAVDNGIAFSRSAMKVNAPTVMDFTNGNVSDNKDYTYTVSAVDVDNANNGTSSILYKDNAQAYKYIAMNYILAGSGVANSDVTFDVFDGATSTDALYETPVPNVPYQRNYRTNIIGNVFAVDGIFNIVIEPAYEDPDYVTPIEGEAQTITIPTTSALAANFDSATLTGTVSVDEGGTLNFSEVASNSPFGATYTSSKPAVGTVDATAGTPVVTVHFNAVSAGVEVKADTDNYASADVRFTVTVNEVVVPVTLESIELTKEPTKEFTVGATWAFDGEVTATYSDESTDKIDANKLTITAPTLAAAGTEEVKISYTEGEVTKELTYEVTVVAATPVDNHGKVASDPFTIAEVKEYIDALGDPKTVSTEDVYVKGVVNQIVFSYSANSAGNYAGTATFWIADTYDSTDRFEAYQVYPAAGVTTWAEGDSDVVLNDEVIVCGKVMKWNTTTYETNGKDAYIHTWTHAVAAPTFSVAAGPVESGTKVTLSCATEGATIYYTTGDGAPTTLYSGAITITEATTIKAVAKKSEMNDSVIAEANYTIAASGEHQVTFNAETCTDMSGTATEQVQTLSGITATISNGLLNGHLRIYKSATLTIAADAGYVIKKIEFNCTASGTSQYGPGCFAELEGYAYEGANGTWEGSETSITFTASSAQVRANSITVTYFDVETE